ncbi:unnamed protein product [Rotaria sp. Silwood2]|nr:unnamed protein product [Rotaria sp. Silwood2]CAF4049275.1 unnamed protein product [Rotaria sp. Silwood2]
MVIFDLVRIECPTCIDEQTLPSPDTSSYKLSDVGEEATFDYKGTPITISVQLLIESQELGSGNFGTVMLTEIKEHPQIKMAVKRLSLTPSHSNPNDYTANTDLITMRTVGSGLNPYVTKFYAPIIDREVCQLLICMELCETSMDKFCTTMHAMDKTQHLDLLLKRMINHIANALLFLKSQNILHRDVKPSNILLNQNPVIFKLCDFGICGRLVDSVTGTLTKGTRIYLAPERIDGNLSPHGYGIRSDMWALGLSTLEIATNKHPFFQMIEPVILTKIETWVPELPSNLSTELQQLVVWLLKRQQEDRPPKYENILVSSAMQSLPTEITKEEADMVKIVIEHIPQLKNANVRMFGVDILMEKDESDGYFRAAIDLADGIYHYQFKIQTKSWFEQDPEPALPNYDDDDDFKDLSPEEKQEKTQAYARLLEEIRERNRQRENEATFTEIWYTFVDPYATDVDERGSGK